MKQRTVQSILWIVIGIVIAVTSQAQINKTNSKKLHTNNKVSKSSNSTVNDRKDVFDVARKGTVSEMKALMAINKDTINATNKNGFQPLLLACYRGNKDVALFLIDHAKYIDATCNEGTALTACVFKAEQLLTEKLLQKGANPNIADDNGITCLMMAVQLSNIDIVKLLLTYKADKTIKDKQGKTAYDYALFTNNKELIDFFK